MTDKPHIALCTEIGTHRRLYAIVGGCMDTKGPAWDAAMAYINRLNEGRT